MASAVQFSLFPPPPPKINTALTSNPFRKAPSKPVLQAASFPLQTLAKSPDAEAVVIQISEESGSLQPMPRARLPPSKETDPTIALEAKAGDGGSPARSKPRSLSSPFESPRHRAPGTATASPARGLAPSPEPVRSTAVPSPKPQSPVVPMRSMFPTFNPNLPLSQQEYYPQRETNLRGQRTSREEYKAQSRSPSPLDQVLGGIKTAPSSVLDLPMDDSAVQRPRFSSPQELEKLWEATNGQEPDAVLPDFDLQMSRVERATFTFGSSPSLPFYSLQTYSTNELAIHRTHPRRPTAKIPILLVSLEPDARRSPPNDGLVSCIFPKLAAMLAIDQSIELAAQHALAPTHRDEMQAEAVARAAAQESCRLTWNEHRRRYELAHPAIGRDAGKSTHFVQTPTSPTPGGTPGGSPVLHITVSSHALASPPTVKTAPPVILVTNPNRSSMALSTPSHTRVSTLPVHESNEPLASLDFGTMTLHLAVRSILQLMPSLYAIDCLVSAILAVAVADAATNPIMAAMDIRSPRPAPTVPGSVAGRSYAGSTLYATLAEREDAEHEAKRRRQLHHQDTKVQSPQDPHHQKKRPFWQRKPKPAKNRPKQILVAEFDLEKLCHYQSGDREGQPLPGLTRSVLKVLVVGLQFVVWTLTTVVRILAWVLVGVTRVVTSEKF